MKCRFCKRDIPDNSIFCNWCGEKQARTRKKTSVRVPNPVQLASGKWHIQLRKEDVYFTCDTAEECIIKAKAYRSGLLSVSKAPRKLTVRDACLSYCAKNSSVLSPSTLNGYESIIRTRFKDYMNSSFASIDWQSAVNDEASIVSPKTVENAWGFITTVMRANGIDVPNVNLPRVVKQDLPWLDFNQIAVFLDGIRNTPGELTALLALHSLRRSELLALSPERVDLGKLVIHVRGSVVRGRDNAMVFKETNKTSSSRRDVPILIPRLYELLSKYPSDSALPYITTNPNSMHGQINSVCRSLGLPLVGVHGLRRSFASLAFYLKWDKLVTMRVGGWSDPTVVTEIYTKLSDAEVNADIKNMRLFYGFTDEFTDEIKKR